MLSDFDKIGYTKVFDLNLGNRLIDFQKLIYSHTKDLIVPHNADIPLEEKIKLPFRSLPPKESWSNIMNNVNLSKEFEDIISSQSIIDSFKAIFKNPKKYEICTFRARYPSEERVIYNWHQDEGTWYLSKNKNHLKKFTATMWLSINGSNSNNSIQLIKNSHKNKLYEHSFVKGQGYFNAKIDKNYTDFFDDILTVETKPSQAIIFHPLTLHRSVSSNKDNGLVPRYSIDVRYYDDGKKLNYSTNFLFKLKKLINMI